jgi:hypothetical protein
MKVEIKSDGTVAGTQVKLDGEDVTGKNQVMRVSFYASCMYTDGMVDFTYAIKEGTGEDTKIVTKTISQSKESTSNQAETGLGANDSEMLNSNIRVGSDYGVYTFDANKVTPTDRSFIWDMLDKGILKKIPIKDSSSDKNEKSDESG